MQVFNIEVTDDQRIYHSAHFGYDTQPMDVEPVDRNRRKKPAAGTVGNKRCEIVKLNADTIPQTNGPRSLIYPPFGFHRAIRQVCELSLLR